MVNKASTTKFLLALTLGGMAATEACAAALAAYGADPNQTSVSGLSSGGFMAVQLQVAYSSSIIGSGVVAGGPYYCAANNMTFLRICLGQTPSLAPNPTLMVKAAKRFASADLIDPLDNLPKRRIYVFSGKKDSVVRQAAVDATVEFFEQLGVKPDNLKYVNEIPAGHALIAPGSTNDCAANEPPFISQCTMDGKDYDQPGAILQHIYGTLRPRVEKTTGQIVSFNQRDYAPPSSGMADTGYLYVPQSCTAANARCKIHVALHGCVQSAEVVGEQFYARAGYNNWADNNKILVLYPQVRKSQRAPSNPSGCWDWWGYTGKNYAYKSGAQMKAIHAMVERLTQPQ